MSDLAVYDMDRTVTRAATYTPFLLHCAVHRAPWRLIFVPLVIGSMLAYLLRLIDRAKLKEINHHLLLGAKIHPRDLKPLVDSFADKQVATNIRPGARIAIARDKAEGRRLVLATASYRLYADAIAARLGFDDVIGTALRTRQGSRPVYVSTGHRVSLETAVNLVMRCTRGFRLPEPIRLAGRLADRRP